MSDNHFAPPPAWQPQNSRKRHHCEEGSDGEANSDTGSAASLNMSSAVSAEYLKNAISRQKIRHAPAKARVRGATVYARRIQNEFVVHACSGVNVTAKADRTRRHT
jgi:hypothetical protein